MKDKRYNIYSDGILFKKMRNIGGEKVRDRNADIFTRCF